MSTLESLGKGASIPHGRAGREGHVLSELRGARVAVLTILAVLAAGSFSRASWADSPVEQSFPNGWWDQKKPLAEEDFILSSPLGFGDRQNSWGWSMQWWNDHLYVGTGRAQLCVLDRMINIGYPFMPYPRPDPDLLCAPDPNDLELQAEIWRWSPAEDIWERVYQSPEVTPIPGTDKFVALDIGFRGMHVFREPDGTEAMYVSGVSAMPIHHDEPRPPPARILRTTDGRHFTPIPQDPGTFLGDLGNASFRGMVTYDDRFYVVAGSFTGPGIVLESADPASGNDTFRNILPQDTYVMEIYPYSGHLYLGLRRSKKKGYAVIRTDAEGDLPYTYVTVIDQGGGIVSEANSDILSMIEFKGYLYCGGNGVGDEPDDDPPREPPEGHDEEPGPIGGAEIVRIHPDDQWDLIVGRPRTTAEGYRVPLSGFTGGFNNPFNNHIWRMAVHDDILYVGTFDSSYTLKELAPTLVGPIMGFDLYASSDGIHFTRVTYRGFGHPLQYGCRSLVSTPYGLFLATATYYYGFQVFRGIR